MTILSELRASVRAELLRLTRWPAFWIVLGSWLLLNLAFAYLFDYLAYRSGAASAMSDGLPRDQLLAQLLPAAVPEVFTQGMAMFGGALMLILGALAVGSGYGWGTWKTAFTQGPRRLAVGTGLLVSLGAVVVALVLAAFAVDLGVATLVAVTEAQPVTLPGVGRSLLGIGTGVAVLGMWTAAGAALGAVARGPAPAVGLGLVWVLVVENLLRGVAGLLGPVETVTNLLPGTAAGSLVGAMRTVDGPATPGVLDILTRGESLIALAIYTVLFAGGTLALQTRRDLV